MRLLELPTAMRDHGVDVVEMAGWQTRGVAFPRPPIAGIDHWTVGAASGELPSGAILTYGRSDLPGPLCNVARGRRTNGRIRAFMIASGRANHAGRGRWATTSGRLATGNSDLFGLEVEYRPWSEPIRDEDLEVDARIHAAAAQVCGYKADDVAGHWEYATPLGRKVDRQTIQSGHLRSLVSVALQPPTTPTTPSLSLEDIMSLTVDGRQLVTDTYEAAGRKTTDAGGRAYWSAMLACTDEPKERRQVINSLRDQLGLQPI